MDVTPSIQRQLKNINNEARNKKDPYGIVLLIPLIFGLAFIYYASEVVLGLEQWTRDFVDRYGNTTLTLFTLAVKLALASFCLLTTIYVFMRKKRAVTTARIALWTWFVFTIFEVIVGYINVTGDRIFFSKETNRSFYAFFAAPTLLLVTAIFISLMLFLNRSKRLDEVLTKK
jgi:uncharacterized membrane protein